MIVDPALAPPRAALPRAVPRARGWEIVLFAVALAVAGLVALTLVFAGGATYSEIALAPGRPPTTFRAVDEERARGPLILGRVPMSPDALRQQHREWTAYVTGRSGHQPANTPEFYTGREREHMADVRNVFIAAQVAAAVAALAAAWLAVRAWRRGTLARLVRAGSVTALVLVAAIAALAAVAFESAFLLFHQIFFPQGNFLFEPSSNLLALYPQEYFYGVTLRIGAGFVAGALLLAAAAHASLRRRGASA